MPDDNGEGRTTAEAARKRVCAWVEKPDHRQPKPGDEERTKEDALDDPALNEED